jgi:iron complex outermembrane receptor protein
MAGDRLTARFSGGEDILALASAAPGLQVENSNGRLSPRFYMRGLGNADFTQAASQPVSIVFDDVPMEKSALKAFPLFDMDDIEVLRGPQGTLFGRNTTAGIIKVDSRRSSEETEGYIKGSAGVYGMFNVEAAVGGTLIEDTLLARVSFMHQNRDDWIDNGFTGQNDALGGFDIAAARLQFLWMPSDNFTALLLHQRQVFWSNGTRHFHERQYS